ncbi:MAG: ELM1/GtrOC1 family putative glycosyltransferase [Pseudomonadota bacterium]
MAVPADCAVWIVCVRKTGHVNQCLALARALGTEPERTILIDGKAAADRPFRKAMLALLTPWQILRARLFHRQPARLLVISSGRSVLPLLRAWRHRAGARLFAVHVGLPKKGAGGADIVVASRHQIAEGDGDRDQPALRGHRRLIPIDGVLARPPAPTRAPFEPAGRHLVILIGGKNVTFDYGAPLFARALARMRSILADGPGTVVFSRRTYPGTAAQTRQALSGLGATFVDAEDREGFVRAVARATHLIVFPDSITMICECCTTGRPVFVPEMDVRRPEHENARFIAAFLREGYILPLDAFAWDAQTRPLEDEAARIAPEIIAALSAPAQRR